jgi:hypothetical protein
MAMSTLDSQLQRISESIAHLNDQPSAMARDLLLQALRECYDEVLQVPLAAATQHSPARKEPQIVAPVVAEPVAQITVEPVHIPAPVVAREPEPVVEEIPEVAAPAAVEVEAEPAPAPTPPVAQSSAENNHKAVKTEQANNDAILAGKLNRKPIADLQSGIPLNEKFGIIRNLFAGNASDFGDAVLKLNNSRSPEELKHYFQLLTQRRGWDMEQESYHVFLDYVDRKASTLAVSDTHTDH